jgi:nitrile hydratase
MSSHDNHDHDHPHAANEDNDLELTEIEARFIALKSILIENGILTADNIRHRLEIADQRTAHNGARMIARAWVDSSFKQRMLADAKAAALELGLEVTEGGLIAVENTADRHNIIVCTLCSCYPRSILGEPPAFYFSRAYRSRAVREPRKVLQEFGLHLRDGVKVVVHDSNADVRYIVLPARPEGTEHLEEEQLAALVSRDCLVGCALPRIPTGA